jgi:hypothetical protein
VEGEASSAGSRAGGGFEVRLPLAKTWQDDAGELWVEGVASSTCVDRQSERMSQAAIERMSLSSGLRLMPSHRAAPSRGLGVIEECWVDDSEFRVRGRLDAGSPDARRLYERLRRGRRYGLSVGGRVRAAHWEHDPSAERSVRVIDDVALDHIALCRPSEAANPSTYLSVMGQAAGALEANCASSACPGRDAEAPEGDRGVPCEAGWPWRARGADAVGAIGRFLAGLAGVLRPQSGQEAGGLGEGGPATGADLAGRLDELCLEVSALMLEVEGLGDMMGKSVATCPPPEAPRAVGVPRGLAGQERVMARESHIWKGVL